MDPVSLASGLVTLLAPFVPVLTGAGQAAANAAANAAAGEVGRRIGEKAVRRLTELWARLWPGLRERPSAQRAVFALARDHTAGPARDNLAGDIAAFLAQDPALLADAAKLLSQSRVIAVLGDRNVVQHGNININAGHVGHLQING